MNEVVKMTQTNEKCHIAGCNKKAKYFYMYYYFCGLRHIYVYVKGRVEKV